MTFPDIDSQDYVTNPERSKPPETPTKVYVVYYLGLHGNWIWSLPNFYLENARKYAALLDRPTRILTYDLTNDVKITDKDRVDWNPQTRAPKHARRVRQPTTVPKKRVRKVAE